MNILLCTPFLNQEGITKGGINTWANIILDYWHSNDGDVSIKTVSFDRRNRASDSRNSLIRIVDGIKSLFIPVIRSINLLNKKEFDIIHICSSASLSLTKDIILLISARFTKTFSVLHLHFGRIPQLYKKKNLEWWLLNTAVSLADRVITMDKASHDILSEKFSKIRYCPNPILAKEIIKSPPTPREAGKIIFVGHVLRTKGVYELVMACSEINDISLHLIGSVDSNIKIDLEQIASYKSNGKWLHIHGEKSHSETLCELKSANCFVLPSYTEGCRYVVLEAMASHCPIVATNVGAIPELLATDTDFPSGICIEPRNISVLKDAIGKMLDDKAFANECADNAQARVLSTYDISVVWDELMSIWREGAPSQCS